MTVPMIVPPEPAPPAPSGGFRLVSLTPEQRTAFEDLRAYVGAMERTFMGSATTPEKADAIGDDCLRVASLAIALLRAPR